MSKTAKYCLAALGVLLILGGIRLYNQEPAESKDRIKVAIKRTDSYRAVDSFLSSIMISLKRERCVLNPDTREVYGYAKEGDAKVICLVSEDWKTVRALVFPSDRTP